MKNIHLITLNNQLWIIRKNFWPEIVGSSLHQGQESSREQIFQKKFIERFIKNPATEWFEFMTNCDKHYHLPHKFGIRRNQDKHIFLPRRGKYYCILIGSSVLKCRIDVQSHPLILQMTQVFTVTPPMLVTFLQLMRPNLTTNKYSSVDISKSLFLSEVHFWSDVHNKINSATKIYNYLI